MKNYIYHFFAGFLYLMIANPSSVCAQNTDRVFKLENLNVTINLIKNLPDGNRIETTFPEEPIYLTSEAVLVEGRTINKLLVENNIFPDGEAYGIVYALNPEIKKLSPLDGVRINLPELQGGKNLRLLFKDNFQVLLTSEKALKQKFSSEVKRTHLLLEQIVTLATEKFINEESKRGFVNELQIIANLLDGIDGRIIQRIGRPLPKEVVQQLISETLWLNADLDSAISDKSKKLERSETDHLIAVRKGFADRAKFLNETAAGEPAPGFSKISVRVRPLKSDGSEVSGLRIKYVAYAYQERLEKGEIFGELTPRAVELLYVANLCFWAVRESDGIVMSVIPACKDLTKEDSNSIVIDLTLK